MGEDCGIYSVAIFQTESGRKSRPRLSFYFALALVFVAGIYFVNSPQTGSGRNLRSGFGLFICLIART